MMYCNDLSNAPQNVLVLYDASYLVSIDPIGSPLFLSFTPPFRIIASAAPVYDVI